MSTTPPMSPPTSSVGRTESVNVKTPGKKRPHEETSESSNSLQASKNGAVNGLPKATDPGRESSLREAKEPDKEDAKQNDKNGIVAGASESKSSEPQQQPFDPRQGIEPFNWQDLESRYAAAMAEQDEVQSALQDEFRKRMNFFNVWAQSAVVHENERAHKRLKTRMHYVQTAERNLVDKRDHYLKVVKAFETALALLGGS